MFCHLDVHESRAGPVSGAQHQGRHLQPGYHHHPHADRQPSLGPEIPADCLPLLPLHCTYFFFFRKQVLLPVAIMVEMKLVNKSAAYGIYCEYLHIFHFRDQILS